MSRALGRRAVRPKAGARSLGRAVRPKAGARAIGRRALIALGLAVLLASACLSPTLPLPPPGQPDTIEGPDQAGYVRLTGTVPPLAVANALNLRTQSGVWQRTQEDGQYVLVLSALAGDQVLLWYSLDREDSPTVRFEIPTPPP